jgi:hypothetical protein
MMTAPRWVLAALIAVAAVMPRAGQSAPFPIDPRASFDIVERGGAVGDNRTLNTEHITATIQMANATVVRGACACVRSCVACARVRTAAPILHRLGSHCRTLACSTSGKNRLEKSCSDFVTVLLLLLLLFLLTCASVEGLLCLNACRA